LTAYKELVGAVDQIPFDLGSDFVEIIG